jgi:hypothetical protein
VHDLHIDEHRHVQNGIKLNVVGEGDPLRLSPREELGLEAQEEEVVREG